MSKKLRLLKFFDTISDYALILFAFIFILAGLYCVYDSYMLYNEATDNSLLKFKPGNSQEDTNEKTISDDMVAWITIDDTTIDYPIMQGEDNKKYINTNPYGEFSMAGSIFLDCRNKKDFSDEYNLIYGHHMEHNLMFGELDRYLEKGYLEKHKTGTLTAGENVFKIRLFAAMETDVSEMAVFAPTEYDGEHMAFIKENSLFYSDDDAPKPGENIIALSTCKFPNTALRNVVFGALTKST